MAYTRKFIILKKEFSNMGGNPKGHGKLEIRGIRGILTVNVENAEKESIYNVLFLLNDKNNPTFSLGKIFTDEWGKGKGEYSFSQRELEAKNLSIDKISALIVVNENGVLLGGYIGKNDRAIETYANSLPKITEEYPQVENYKEEAEEVEEIEEQIYEEIVQEEEEKIEEEFQEEIEKQYVEDKLNSFTEQETLTQETLTQETSIQETSTHEPTLDKIIKKESQENHTNLDYMKRLNQKNQTTMYVLSILRFFPYIDPFKYDLNGFNWWIVELDKENEYKSFLPYFSHITGGNNKQMYKNTINCNELINKYKHYLFGLYNEGEEVKYYVYGIPGSFTREEHPHNGERGFSTWYQGKKAPGYWVLYIDPMTGKPVYPQVPMIPIN